MDEYKLVYRYEGRDYLVGVRDRRYYVRSGASVTPIEKLPFGTAHRDSLDTVVLHRDGYNSLAALPGAIRSHYLYDLETGTFYIEVLSPEGQPGDDPVLIAVPESEVPDEARDRGKRLGSIRRDIRAGRKYRAIRGHF